MKSESIVKSLLGIVVAFLSVLPNAFADENLFGYVTSAETLPQGAHEAYLWATHRYAKRDGSYNALDFRQEYEYGLYDHLSVALYLNERYHRIKGVTDFEDKDDFNFQGVQTSAKYQFLNPFTDLVGIALYLEPGYSRNFKITGEQQQEWSFETKLIVQKNFLDDQFVWATHFMNEIEFRRFNATGEKEYEGELAQEVASGLSYRFSPNWFAGLEARWHSELPDIDWGNREHGAFFLGPNIHYGGKDWWATLTVLPQVNGWPDSGGDTRHLAEHEKIETRIKIGYNF